MNVKTQGGRHEGGLSDADTEHMSNRTAMSSTHNKKTHYEGTGTLVTEKIMTAPPPEAPQGA